MFSERVRLRLQDMAEQSDRIAGYIAGCDVDAYLADPKTSDAVERCLSRLTEAVIQLGEEEVERLDLGAPWHKIRALGNRLRHEYRRINPVEIFRTVSEDLPPLREAVSRALEA